MNPNAQLLQTLILGDLIKKSHEKITENTSKPKCANLLL